MHRHIDEMHPPLVHLGLHDTVKKNYIAILFILVFFWPFIWLY